MAICAELSHTNIVRHIETILEDKSIYMVFAYCAHDLLQLVHRHGQSSQAQSQSQSQTSQIQSQSQGQSLQRHIPASMIKSIMYQLLQGCAYLHKNWIMHRDLKPANIMVTAEGTVKLGDLGLARIFRSPLVPLWSGDKVVVTIWYRAPELLMGARHYTPAIDLWAIGCIFGELLCLRPMFKGEETKADNKKSVPFQKHQMQKIMEVLGVPDARTWPTLGDYPDLEREQLKALVAITPKLRSPMGLRNWFEQTIRAQRFPADRTPGKEAFDLLQRLLDYDPTRRITAAQALEHAYFSTSGPPKENCFEGLEGTYPERRVVQDEANATNLPGTKRSGLPDDTRPGKRLKP